MALLIYFVMLDCRILPKYIALYLLYNLAKGYNIILLKFIMSRYMLTCQSQEMFFEVFLFNDKLHGWGASVDQNSSNLIRGLNCF